MCDEKVVILVCTGSLYNASSRCFYVALKCEDRMRQERSINQIIIWSNPVFISARSGMSVNEL